MTEKRFIVKSQPPLWVTDDGLEIESACCDLFDTIENKKICQFEHTISTGQMIDLLNELSEENKELKKEDELFFGKVFDILLKYQDLFNREMADEVLEELGIELTRWFE